MITLPENPVKASIMSPRITLLYGMPKVGKTEQSVLLTKMSSALILDTEEGTDMYDAVKINIRSIKDIDDTIAAIETVGAKNIRDGKTGDDIYPYKFIILDTIDAFEDMCEISATIKYKKTAQGSKFTGDTVLELAHGLGYGLLRNEVKEKLIAIARRCKYLILISHVDDKIVEKNGVMVSSKDISLTGKLKKIIPALCDAIGYLNRKEGQLYVNFETVEDTTMGARFKYLVGKNIPFDWKEIYLELKEQ